MSASGKIGDRLTAAAQVAGAAATAWFVWINAVRPRLGLESLAGMAAEALSYVALAWICGAVVTFWVYLVVSLSDLQHGARFSLRTAAPAMWFAPTIVLLSAPSAAAVAVSLFLVVNATRHLVSRWTAMESPFNRGESLFWNPAPVMGSSMAQAGLVAILWHHPLMAAALFAASAAILTSLSIAAGAGWPEQPPVLPHSALSVVMTLVLAVALTFGGISVRGRGGAESEAASDASGSGGAAAGPITDPTAPPVDSTGFGGDFPGVILLPELKPNTMLFVPLPAPPTRFGVPLAEPVGIPFSGEYWMFRWPARRPPLRSVIRRGKATELSFHTTDGWPMEMEAHQKLDQPVDLKCCTRIQLDVLNAEPSPGIVSLELTLMDSAAGANATQSLGSVLVGSPPPSEQVLSFRIPRATALRKFDEIKVVFHRDQSRYKSARIAIERFVLAP